ncbi:hypothetical protein [Paenibacillus xylanivorans]|uniref:BIG2 domain-containing protein n=1 Tax=Paenibacillus xylanivorans TaxID=1705561 RepID=A0A0M9BS18_9BACL|nr:hypothetical protein [Paenibacillus xylanivorans]KOY17853.1 hypothetical protein AMS66_03745 [Paenibacillus xylanivorans]
MQIVASYGKSTFGIPKKAISYSSSSPADLKVSADGMFEGVKPSRYKVKFSSGVVRETVTVRVCIRAPQEQELPSN